MRKLFPNFSYKHITFAIVDTTNYNQQPHVSDLENPLNDAVKLNKLNTNKHHWKMDIMSYFECLVIVMYGPCQFK